MNGVEFAWNADSSHSCSHVNIFSLGPDENPANVQGIGSEPDNLVITWEVSLGVWVFLLLVFKCLSNFFLRNSNNLRTL